LHNKPSNIIAHIGLEKKQFGIYNGFCHEHITHKKQSAAAPEAGKSGAAVGNGRLFQTDYGLCKTDDGL
jgi:hypothetical protein